MTYLIKNLGWRDKEIFLFMMAHVVLLIWSITLVLNTKTLSEVSLLINYLGIFTSGLLMTKYRQKLQIKTNELEG